MKTKIRSLVLFLFVIQVSFAQDYACIKPLDTVYFEKPAGFLDESLVVPLIITNTTVSNDTIYHQNISDWSFRNITSTTDGKNYFTNHDMDTITINTFANINDTWKLYTYPNNNYIEAKVTSIEQEEFLSITDDIKTISFQLKDEYGDDIIDNINNAYISISKNHGFVHLPDFYQFPGNTSAYYSLDIIGYNSYGYQDFGVATIYDFEIGDNISSYEYERLRENGYLIESYDLHQFEEVIAKETSNNGDLITYTFDACSKSRWGVDNETWSFGQGVFSQTIDFTIPEYACYNQISTTTQDYIGADGSCKRITIGSDANSKYIISIYEGIDCNNLVLTYPDGQVPNYCSYFNHHIIGKGGPFYDYGCYWDWDKAKILTNTQSCSALLDTKEELTEETINIYPNPVNNKLHISLNNENSFSQYSLLITDITGKRHLELNQNSNEFTIDTSKLVDGLYILQLVGDKGVLTKKFVVRH